MGRTVIKSPEFFPQSARNSASEDSDGAVPRTAWTAGGISLSKYVRSLFHMFGLSLCKALARTSFEDKCAYSSAGLVNWLRMCRVVLIPSSLMASPHGVFVWPFTEFSTPTFRVPFGLRPRIVGLTRVP